MWCATGTGLSAAGWVLSGRAHETRAARCATVAAAAAVTSGVIRLSAPSWSSLAPASPVGERGVEGEDVGGGHGVTGHGRTVARRPYARPMTTLQGDYEPSPSDWVRDQVAEYEASGGQRANTLLDTGMPIIVVATRGAKSGKVRKNPVMRVEHDGEYALVASKGGAPENPEWYHNLVAHPDEVDDPGRARAVRGAPCARCTATRRRSGGSRAVAAYPPYAEYQEKTTGRSPSSSPAGSEPARPRRTRPRQRAAGERVDHGGAPRAECGLALERGLAEAHHDEVERRADGDRLPLVARGAEGADGCRRPRPTSARRRGCRPRGRPRPWCGRSPPSRPAAGVRRPTRRRGGRAARSARSRAPWRARTTRPTQVPASSNSGSALVMPSGAKRRPWRKRA